MSKTRRPSIFSILSGIVIDLALMGMGATLYYHFLVKPLGPVGLSPIVVNLFGSLTTAVLVIAGLPFLIGSWSLLQTLLRLLAPRPTVPAKK
jgi:hypothetical protein